MPQIKNIVGNVNISVETNLHVDDHTADLALNLFCLNAKEKGVPGFLIEIGKDGMPHVSALETRDEVEYLQGEHVAWGPDKEE